MMHRILTIVFPLWLYLHILQLERYQLGRFYRWIIRNPFVRSVENKKPLVMTNKARYLRRGAVLVSIAIGAIIWQLTSQWHWGLLVFILLMAKPHIGLSLSLLSLKPYEIWNRARIIKRTRASVAALEHTKIIGITGSNGKTSVKNVLYHILRAANKKVLKTPASYNTIFGLAKVVEFELTDDYDYCIAEMGAFKAGDIWEMCEMMLPQYGILTTINEQHLERFGGISNTIKAKLHLPQYIQKHGTLCVVNSQNKFIDNAYPHSSKKIMRQGHESDRVFVRNMRFSRTGTEADLIIDDVAYPISMNLWGQTHLLNIQSAAALAIVLEIPIPTIVDAVSTLPQIEHRLERKVLPSGLTILDNAYSSSVEAMRLSVALVKELPYNHKIIVTPGLVELGNQSVRLHQELGAHLIGFDQVYLVGNSHRTKALATPLPSDKVTFLDSINQIHEILAQLPDPRNTVVLLENDLPDNY